MNRIIITITILIALNACMDFTSGKRYKEEQIVVAGMLIAGESITTEQPIFVGKSVMLDDFNPMKLFERNALVTLTEVSSDGKPITLVYNNSINPLKAGFYDPSDYKIKTGETYRIDVVIDGHDPVWAETTVPEKFILTDNSGFSSESTLPFPKMLYDEIEEKHNLKLKLNNQDDTYVYMEFYCMEEWYDAYIVSPFSDYIGETFESGEDYENTMNGSPRLNKDLFIETPDADNEIRTAFFQLNFFFYGRYEVRVHVVDENYFNYNKKTNGYIHGGVKGGIGYFASAVKETRYTQVVKYLF